MESEKETVSEKETGSEKETVSAKIASLKKGCEKLSLTGVALDDQSLNGKFLVVSARAFKMASVSNHLSFYNLTLIFSEAASPEFHRPFTLVEHFIGDIVIAKFNKSNLRAIIVAFRPKDKCVIMWMDGHFTTRPSKELLPEFSIHQ